MKPHNKLFISSGNITGSFGDGKWRLLNAVKKYGSIQKAATALGRSYRKAWGDIKRAEEAFGRPLVVKNRGGTSGGSTELTDFGLQLLKGWSKYRSEVEIFIEKSYKRHLQPFIENENT
jgi:molybdate transport system regulatory protein